MNQIKFNPTNSPQASIKFCDRKTGETLGEFKEINNKLTFEGEESGKIFVDFICKSYNERMKEFALKVATEAVGDDRQKIYSDTFNEVIARDTRERILKNIKKRLKL